MVGSLEGVRVLELARYQAGPRSGMILSDLGAEVIKIEKLGGEETRRSEPLVRGQSVYFSVYNRGKKSLCLDMRAPRGKEVFAALVPTADVVLENFRPGTMAQMGFGYDQLRALKPDIILTSVSGFGQYGPYRERPAFDPLGQAMSGLMSLTGAPVGTPLGAATSPVDPVRLTGADALRAKKALLVVTDNSVHAAVPQEAYDLVRKAVFVDAVAEANQLVGIAEYFQRLPQAGVIAVHVRDNANLHGWLRRAIMFIGFRLMTIFPSWFSTSISVRTMPRSGLEREGVASSTETRMRSTSPGRTGCSQRNSSMPGEARLAAFGRKLSARSRIIIAPVCQPLAIRPPKRPRFAASGSTCMSCGSKRRAKSRISASSTWISPYSKTVPGM